MISYLSSIRRRGLSSPEATPPCPALEQHCIVSPQSPPGLPVLACFAGYSFEGDLLLLELAFGPLMAVEVKTVQTLDRERDVLVDLRFNRGQGFGRSFHGLSTRELSLPALDDPFAKHAGPKLSCVHFGHC